ncbi:MAG: 3'-5' exonuclease, partial [Acidimicrobiia bacterium]
EQNYRSTEVVLEAANAVISRNDSRKPKTLWTDLGRGDPLVRYEAEDERDEAGFVAERVGELQAAGRHRSDIAVFYRTNAQSRVLEEILVRYGVPYQVVGGPKFYDRREIRDVLAYLRVLANSDDEVALKRIVNVPRRGIGDTSIAHLERFAETAGVGFWIALTRFGEVEALTDRARSSVGDFVALVRHLQRTAEHGPRAALQAVLDDTGYMDGLQAEHTIEALGRVDNLKELTGVAGEFEDTGPALLTDGEVWSAVAGPRRLELFLESVSLVNDTDAIEAEDVLTLMTLHNAKGLEFPVVFLTGMEDGIFPHMRSLGDPGQLEEERRLCYVGITRAKELLFVTSAWSRNLYGATNYNSPSRFVKEIPADLMMPAKRVRNAAMEAVRPQATVTAAEIEPGDRVRHDRWGPGTVERVVGGGDGAEAIVRFDEEGTKRLLLAWAPLQKG